MKQANKTFPLRKTSYEMAPSGTLGVKQSETTAKLVSL